MASPFTTYAGLLERVPHLVRMYLSNDPQVVGYQFWGAPSINDAYGNPVGSGVGGAGAQALFEVSRGVLFRSPRLKQKGLALIPENMRGTTHAAFDWDDFLLPGGLGANMDEQYTFVRVQENRRGVGLLNLAGVPADPVLGPVYLIPSVDAFGMVNASFTTTGTAPSGTPCAAGATPSFSEDLTSAAPRPLVVVFPTPLREFTLLNQDGVNDLLVSFGFGQPMMTVPAGQVVQLFSGSTKMIILACPAAGGCPFSLHGSLA
jgi:hypothetical protein